MNLDKLRVLRCKGLGRLLCSTRSAAVVILTTAAERVAGDDVPQVKGAIFAGTGFDPKNVTPEPCRFLGH